MSSLDEFQARYIDELTAAAAVLGAFETAAQAEAWISGAVAEWQALDGAPGELAPAISTSAPLAAALIGWFNGGPVPSDDEPWLADLGQERLERVLQLADADNPNEVGLIFEYMLDEVHDHDMSVSLVGGALTGITVGPAGLADGVLDDEETSLAIHKMEQEKALRLVAEALSLPLDDLSPASEANVPFLLRRVGIDASVAGGGSSPRQMPERDAEDDAWCVDVVRSALREVLNSAPPEDVEHARADFAQRIEGRDPDALTILAVAGLDGAPAGLDAFSRAVGAYLNPVDLSAHTDAQFEALIELEPVDWTGVILGMTRSKAGAPPIDGNSLVTFINRAPEITSTIPKADSPRLAWAFEQMLFSWEATGVIDSDGQVTPAGRWLLPHAFVASLGR